MKSKTIFLLLSASCILISCGGGKSDEEVIAEAKADSIIIQTGVPEMAMAPGIAKILERIPRDLTADSIARTLFYVLDSVNVPFTEASIELATTHKTTADGSASFIIASYEGSNERERSGTTTYNFAPRNAKTKINAFTLERGSAEDLQLFKNTFNISNANEANAEFKLFKRRRNRILAQVDFASELIKAIKDAVDSKNKINDLKNETYELKDLEVELSFLITNSNGGKLEFKLWDKLGLGGGLAVENSYEHKITIKFDNN